MKASLVLLLVVAFCFAANALNNRPIIGIITQPGTGGYGDPQDAHNATQYLAASYVKFIESGGGRVVPIFFNSTKDELDNLFDSINGILFPGGDADFKGKFWDTSNYLYSRFLDANDKGDFFPIVGHCLGFELEAALVSQNPNILTNCLAENISMHLNFTSNAPDSRWFANVPRDIYDNLASKNICLNNHQYGVTPKIFNETSLLNEFFSVLSTNYDVKGREFISTWEGLTYPMYGIQWHAEKPQFEWNADEDINHDTEAIQAMSYFSRFFIDQARRSHHHYKNYTEEYNSLIYNFNPVYTEASDPDFEQIYIWY
jgi:gamma-glutamyl hydrolase